jgi:hypothetical protein
LILYTEGSTDAQASEAEKVMAILCQAYPGHPWAVRVDEGIIFIRHLENAGPWGMNLKTREVDHDAAVLKHKIIMAAGEWLERAGLARGRENGDEIVSVEGVPIKAAQFENVVVSQEPLRDAPRPQALK